MAIHEEDFDPGYGSRSFMGLYKRRPDRKKEEQKKSVKISCTVSVSHIDYNFGGRNKTCSVGKI